MSSALALSQILPGLTPSGAQGVLDACDGDVDKAAGILMQGFGNVAASGLSPPGNRAGGKPEAAVVLDSLQEKMREVRFGSDPELQRLAATMDDTQLAALIVQMQGTDVTQPGMGLTSEGERDEGDHGTQMIVSLHKMKARRVRRTPRLANICSRSHHSPCPSPH